MEKRYEDRLSEIDSRIASLKEHMVMWGRAGGDKMAMQAVREINALKAEKERILNGSQVKIDEIQDKIDELQRLRAQCKIINFIKKMKLSKAINSYEEEKSNILKRKN